MTTGLELINSTLRSIGALGAGETAEATISADMLKMLNMMIDGWSSKGALIFGESKVTKVLTAGDGSYSIGSGADIDTARPVEIKKAFVSNGTWDYALELIDEQRYADISRKDAQLYVPSHLYYDGNYPTGNIYLWPIPSAAYTLNLYVRQPLSALTLAGTISLPPGYEEALKYNLGMRAAPEFGRMVDAEYKRIAKEGLKMIKSANKRNDQGLMQVDGALQNREARDYNVYTGR